MSVCPLACFQKHTSELYAISRRVIGGRGSVILYEDNAVRVVGLYSLAPTAATVVQIRGVHGNGEDWDPMGPMGFPWEWE